VFTSYTLDKNNTLIDIDGPWDQFAEQNNGENARAEQVLGRSIWEFIEGFETLCYLNAIFSAVRKKQRPFHSLYRCDSPEEKRIFEMQVLPLHGTQITVIHRLQETRLFKDIDNVADLSKLKSEKRCSICARFEVGGAWIVPLARPPEQFFPKSYTVCPDCRLAAKTEIEGLPVAKIFDFAQ